MVIRTRFVSAISFRLHLSSNPFRPLFAEGRIPEEDTEVTFKLLVISRLGAELIAIVGGI
jgi:hypothetical protein